MNFRKVALILALVFAGGISFAQITVQGDHDFYSQAQIWENRGVVSTLPLFRPYPGQVVKTILDEAIKNGNESDRQIAREYYADLTRRPIMLEVSADGTKVAGTNGCSFGEGEMYATGDLFLLDGLVNVGYELGALARTKESYDNHLPKFIGYGIDAIQDPARIGSLWGYFVGNNAVSLCKNGFVLQTGVYSPGYGDWIGRGLALNETAYHGGNISLGYQNEKFSYSQIMSAIGASYSYDGSGWAVPNKFLSMHVAELHFNRVFSFAYYENMIIFNRFDPSYLIPATYMAIQGLGGCSDNLQMGLSFKVRPFKGFLWSTDIFVDDVDFNNDIKFHFDTRNRAAGQTGVVWNPDHKYIKKAEFCYTLVSPYTYSHLPVDSSTPCKPGDYNFQDYTNNGLPIGTNYLPNSQVFRLGAVITPSANITVNATLLYSMFGNVNESLTDDEALVYMLADKGSYSTAGNVFNHHYYDKGFVGTAMNHLNLLTQSHKMHTVQAGWDVCYKLPAKKWGKITLKGGYLFEYIHNANCDSDMFEGGADDNHDGTYSYDGQVFASSHDLVDYAKSKWASGLYDSFRNYLSVGINYKF